MQPDFLMSACPLNIQLICRILWNIYNVVIWNNSLFGNLHRSLSTTDFVPSSLNPYEAQTSLFKDPVRTAL